ncbi:MAG: hypothetical protein B7Y99_08640 [Caulobacterales bacterium 32-69-10]|nr:MAG: hypothetical protein B7Y99_08640 [Caulobacterales bacterium 32-69-10]
MLFIGLSVAAIGGIVFPSAADAAPHRSRQAAKAAPRGLDLSVTGPSVAMQAARAAQAASLPGAAPAQLSMPAPVETPTTAAAGTVSGVTVTPQMRPRGKVIASSDAAPLSSPDFSAADAAPEPLAIAIAPNTALGRQVVSNRPAVNAGGLLGTNPELLGVNPNRGLLGVTTVY